MVNSIDTKSVIKIQGRISQTYATSPLSWQTKETTTQYRRQTTPQFSYDILISNIELIEGFFPPIQTTTYPFGTLEILPHQIMH